MYKFVNAQMDINEVLSKELGINRNGRFNLLTISGDNNGLHY